MGGADRFHLVLSFNIDFQRSGLEAGENVLRTTSEFPRVRHVVGEARLVKKSDPASASCIGWIAGSSPAFEP